MNPAIGLLALNVRKFVALRAVLPVRHRADDLLPIHDFVCVIASGFLGLWFSHTAEHLAGHLIIVAAMLAAVSLRDRDFPKTVAAGPAAVIARLASQLLPLLMVMAAVAFASDWLVAASIPWLAAWWLVALPLLLLGRLTAGRAQARVDAAVARNRSPNRTEPVQPRLASSPIDYRQRALKAALDLVIGGLALVLVLPLLAMIAVAIRLDSPGPILFRQRRHGFRSREFEIFKFRTMRIARSRPGGDCLQQTRIDDDRVTRVGRILRKYSLDELPQLFNVLQGSMSLVGPRPHAVNMRTEDRLGEQIVDDYLFRHRLLPGITGLSQVSGLRGATDTTEQLRRRVELDLHYIEHWSLLLDLKILLLTFRAVMKTTNAY